MCSLRIQEESEWEKHVVECGRKRRQKRFECSHCEYATNKKSDMDRHCRTRHGGYAKADSESEEDWEQLDPGTLSDVVGETASATSPEMTQRKPTRPDPVHTPKSKLLNKRSMMPVAPTPFKHPMTTVKENVPSATVPTSMQDRCVQASFPSNGVDKSTQTLPCEHVEQASQTEGSKRRRLDRIQESYQRDGKSVVEIHEDELWFK